MTLAAIIMKTDHKYPTLIKYLPKNTFDFSQAAQIVKLLPDANALTDKFQGLRHVKLNLQNTHLLSQIGYVICPTNATNKANIHLLFIKYILVTCSILSTEFYAMAYILDIEKKH